MTIFFDVDGVLNKKSDWTSRFCLDASCVRAFAFFVEKLSKKHPVNLVICSTWRAGIGRNQEDSRQMQHLASALYEYGLKISGHTPLSNKGRQAEIEYYIRRNGVEKYLVIDDDESLYEDPDRINLYIPDYRTGFTAKDVKAALAKCR